MGTFIAPAVAAPEHYDVVVAGAGPIGALYATLLKRARPETRVLMLDRAPEPGHKIGESTLSGFCKALRAAGVPREVMRRLFYPKNGLGFLHVTESTPRLEEAPEYVLETFDETYQVERRVLDTLLELNAARFGVEVRRGAAVDLKASYLGADGNRLAVVRDGVHTRVACRLFVDASGPAAILARHLGLRRDDAAPFQTSAVWTYYDEIRPLATYDWPRHAQFPRDQYTQHLCFAEGWLWYIPITSWQAVPTPDLRQGLAGLLAEPGAAAADLPRTLGRTPQPIVSIGLSLRSDRAPEATRDPRATFDRYTRRYPAVAQLLGGAAPLADYYGRGRTFQSRAAFRGYSERAAGDGWLLVGDAAFFVDPLISPGLTGGVAGAFQAVAATRQALDADRTEAAAFGEYDAFIRRLHGALERDNQLVYMSFDHPGALALVQRFQECYARRHFLDNRNRAYDEADTNVWGILDDGYQSIQRAAWELMRDEELAAAHCRSPHGDYDRMVRRLGRLLRPHLDDDLTPYVRANSGALALAGRRM